MKRAFSLMEVLLTLGIIGIVTAVLLPSITRIRPDQNKIMFLKTYDVMIDAVKNVTWNSKFYPKMYTARDGVEHDVYNDDVPLANTNCPLDAPGNCRPLIGGISHFEQDFEGKRKFCHLLRDYLQADAANNSNRCRDTDIDFINNRADFNTAFTNHPNFSTKNGAVLWYITPGGSDRYYIALDVNGSEGPNNFYDPNNSGVVPDRFAFGVSLNGTVMPLDPYSALYLRTREHTNEKTYTADDLIDYDDAEEDFEALTENTPNWAP